MRVPCSYSLCPPARAGHQLPYDGPLGIRPIQIGREMLYLIVHATHTAHATARHSGGTTFLLRPFGDHGFRGDQKPGDRRCILQRRPHNLGWVDDAFGDEIDVLAVLGVEAVRILVLLKDLADDDRPIFARIDDNLTRRPGERLAHDIDAGFLVVVLCAYLLQYFGGAQECDAAARQDAFLDCGTGGVHRVVNAILALLHLDLGSPADADHCNAAGEFRQPFLQLLLVVVGRGLLDLDLDLRDTRFDVGLLAGTFDDRSVLFLDHHFLGAPEHVHSNLVEFDAEILADRLSAGEDRDVFEHRLAAVAEARSLHRRHFQSTAQLVDDKRCQGLALNVLGDDDERLRGLDYRFE